MLFVMPLWKKPEKQNLILIVYNVDSGEKMTEFYSEKVKRKPPLVYKESGEKRLYAYNDKLVQIVPSDTWTILTYEIECDFQDCESSTQGQKVSLNLISIIPLTWVELSAIGQLFCADQQGPHLLLAFFTERQGLNTYSSKIVTLDMSSSSTLHSMSTFLLKLQYFLYRQR